MLQNPVYTGTLVIQKTFVADPITHHQVVNRGEKNKYVVEDHHEAIIDPDILDGCRKNWQDGRKKDSSVAAMPEIF